MLCVFKFFDAPEFEDHEENTSVITRTIESNSKHKRQLSKESHKTASSESSDVSQSDPSSRAEEREEVRLDDENHYRKNFCSSLGSIDDVQEGIFFLKKKCLL